MPSTHGSRYDWAKFLGRAGGKAGAHAAGSVLGGKSILVTGAGGSIGSALARRIAEFAPKQLVLLDTAEHGLSQLAIDLRESGPARELVVGDACDPALLASLYYRFHPQVIFHAAACKHVALMETNPLAAARNNILATVHGLEAANRFGAQQFVLVSTDKAVAPASMMGATKRIAELLVAADAGPVQARAVRLGNVLGSAGSAAPAFERQLERGRPLIITDPACRRYFVSMEEAVHILLSSLLVEDPGRILAARTGPLRSIVELARFMAESHGFTEETMEITYSGLRPGEKLSEAMCSYEEALRDSNVEELQIVDSDAMSGQVRALVGRVEEALRVRDIDALLSAIGEILPEYRPSAALTTYAQASRRGISA
jgi:FlaA1/EpsC-like NDP-sugar epimerase